MSEPFDEFMDDVEKDLRQENYRKLWQSYGKYVTGGILGILGAVCLGSLYFQKQEEQLRLASEKYSRAQMILANGDVETALGVLKSIAVKDSPTYASLADLTQSYILRAKGGADFNDAQQLLLTLAASKTADPLFANFAKILYVQNVLTKLEGTDLTETQTEDLQSHVAMLHTVCQDGQPFHLLALDVQGFLYIMLRDFDKASANYIKINQSKECPEGLRTRAELLGQYVIKNITT